LSHSLAFLSSPLLPFYPVSVRGFSDVFRVARTADARSSVPAYSASSRVKSNVILDFFGTSPSGLNFSFFLPLSPFPLPLPFLFFLSGSSPIAPLLLNNLREAASGAACAFCAALLRRKDDFLFSGASAFLSFFYRTFPLFLPRPAHEFGGAEDAEHGAFETHLSVIR